MNMANINAYLNFKDNCREAMNFYKECFGGELNLQTFGESPMSEQFPELKDKIMHSTLKSGGILLMASDSTKPENYSIGNAVVLSVNCDSEEEVDKLFAKLSEGGKITMPLADQFWGGKFGALTDKFGLHWMFNFQKAPMTRNK